MPEFVPLPQNANTVAAERPPVQRRVNYRFVLVLFVAGVLFGVGVHFLHGFQVQRSADLLLARADQAEKERNYGEAADFLRRYLAYEPANTAVMFRWGIALDEYGKKVNSPADRLKGLDLLEQGLRRDARREDVRRRLIDLAMDLGDFESAQLHVQTLRKLYPKEPLLLKRLAQCELETSNAPDRFANAAKWLEEARAATPPNAPADLELYQLLMSLYRTQLDNPSQADELMQDLVDNYPKMHEALVLRARYLIQFARNDAKNLAPAAQEQVVAAKLDEADRSLGKASELSANATEVAVVRAALAVARKDLALARQILTEGLKVNPKHVALLQALIALEQREGNAETALALARQALKAAPDQPELLLAVAGLLLSKGEFAQAEKTVARLESIKYSSFQLEVLKAHLAIYHGKWGEAATRLERVRPQLSSDVALGLDLALAQCHERLGNPDQALNSFQQALKGDLTSVEARLGMATALMALDRVDEAIAAYRQTLTLAPAAAQAPVRLALIRALIIRNLRLPPEHHDWAEVRVELEQAERLLEPNAELHLLKAETVLQSDGDKGLARARQLLEEARTAFPDRPEVWVALAHLAGRKQAGDPVNPRAALTILDEAAANPKLLRNAEVLVARVDFLRQLPEKEGHAALLVLENQPCDDRARLWSALVQAHLLLGARADAERVCLRMTQQQPNDLGAALMLFDLQLIAGNVTGLARTLQAVETAEGGRDGPYWNLSRALLLVRSAAKQSGKPDAKQLNEARQNLNQAAKRRPTWCRIAALAGEIDDLEGLKAQALSNYQDAVSQGERRPAVLRRYGLLLIQENREAELSQLVARFLDQPELLLAIGWGKLAASNLLANNREAALKLAEQSVQHSKEYTDYLWLGQLYLQVRRADARKAFETACALQPAAPEPYLVLVSYFISLGDPKSAAAVIDKASRFLPGADAPPVLAVCHEMLGQTSQAEKILADALTAQKGDLQAMQNLIGHYVRSGQPHKAEPYLRKMVAASSVKDNPDHLAWARRSLARVLASKRDFHEFKKAMELLDDNQKARPNVLDDLRARAAVLSTRPERRKDAIRLYEQIQTKHTLENADKWILAQLYDADGQPLNSEAVLTSVMNARGGNQAEYYCFYISRVLSKRELAKAQPWLDKLDKLEPDSLRTCEVKALALAVQDKDDDAVTLAAAFAKEHPADKVRLARSLEKIAAVARDKAGYYKLAEALYRQRLAAAPTPADHLTFAEFLSRRGRLADALAQCELALKKSPPEAPILTAVTVLRVCKPGEADCKRVEGWLRDAIAKSPNPGQLHLLLAEYFDYRGDYAEVVVTLQGLLRAEPKHALALNNLAWLTAVKDRRGVESLQLIDKAIASGGPLPDFLDTKGLCYLVLKDYNKAVQTLAQAVAAQPSPMGFFHLSLAQLEAGNKIGARTALTQAKALGLTAASVHPLERPEYDRLIGILQKD
jgi:tetratricopeptide (TPR) repeat protein